MKDTLKEIRQEMLSGDTGRANVLFQLMLNDAYVLQALEDSFLESMGNQRSTDFYSTAVIPDPTSMTEDYIVAVFAEEPDEDVRSIVSRCIMELGKDWDISGLFDKMQEEISVKMISLDYVSYNKE